MTSDAAFRKELEAIASGKPLMISFFESVEKVIRNLIKESTLSLLNIRNPQTDRDVYWEVTHEFIANYLFEEGNERIRYLIQEPDQYANPVGMIRRMFRQYISSLIEKKNPYHANIFRKIKAILKDMEKTGQIERRCDCYRKTGDQSCEIVNEKDLADISRYFPPWNKLYQSSDAEKVCPVIRSNDLLCQIQLIFDRASGWVRQGVLIRFYIDYMGLPNCLVSDLSVLSDKDIAYSANRIQSRLSFDDVYHRLTPRQKEIFVRHFLNGEDAPEIAESLSFKKSTIYAEIDRIRKLFDDQMEN